MKLLKKNRTVQLDWPNRPSPAGPLSKQLIWSNLTRSTRSIDRSSRSLTPPPLAFLALLPSASGQSHIATFSRPLPALSGTGEVRSSPPRRALQPPWLSLILMAALARPQLCKLGAPPAGFGHLS
jgi:hypothetical protein